MLVQRAVYLISVVIFIFNLNCSAQTDCAAWTQWRTHGDVHESLFISVLFEFQMDETTPRNVTFVIV